jgi:alanyl-tRNA synthetase
MGGQVGDKGSLQGDKKLFIVTDCKAPFKGINAHQGMQKQGSLKVGDSVTAELDAERRQKIANNHTATHLLHWALHKVLGEHVKQAGSVVDPERLRFDFSHHKALTREEIQAIEDLVNKKIRENLPVKWYEIPYEEAQKKPEIKQFFGEKYASNVRVIDIDYSKELCGGTHTSALGNIGLFRIEKEGSIAAGVRRIEAVTGGDAENFARQSEDLVESLATLLKAQPLKLKERIDKLVDEHKQMGQELKAAKKKELQDIVEKLAQKVETRNHLRFLVAEVPGGPEELRSSAEDLFAKLQSPLVLALGARTSDKGHLMIRVSDDLVKQGIQAQTLIQQVAPIIEGTGGGKPNNAQAGGKAPDKIPEALAKIRALLTP